MASQSEAPLLTIGRQCSEPLCHLVDFLPFKCQHCSKSFCAEHFKVDDHKCPEYDEYKFNRVAPSCPLCNEPVAIPPGQDPNFRMDRHIASECSVTTGKANKSKSPVCGRGKCGKVLFAPIQCDGCKQQFCPQHRFPKDHACSAPAPAPKPKPPRPLFRTKDGYVPINSLRKLASTRTSSSSAPVSTSSTSASSAPASTSSTRADPKASTNSTKAIVSTQRSSGTPGVNSSAPNSSKSTPPHSTVFSKTDRTSSPASPTVNNNDNDVTTASSTTTHEPQPANGPLSYVPRSMFTTA